MTSTGFLEPEKFWYRVDDTEFSFRHLELEGLPDILADLNCRKHIWYSKCICGLKIQI